MVLANLPLVSVVLGVYNSEASIGRTLESILSERSIDLEVIVVNDGSTDETLGVLHKYKSVDERVRLIDQSNQGLTKSLINGCSLARGKYIARIDADDINLPGRIPLQLGLIESDPNFSFVSCWARAVGPGGEPLYEICRPIDTSEATNQLKSFRMGPPHHGTVLMKKKLYDKVGGYRQQFYFAQDSDLWLRLIEVGTTSYVPQFLYEFRITAGSISSRYRHCQHELGELGHECRLSRLNKEPEEYILKRAERLRPGMTIPLKTDSTAGNYFIARCLLRKSDRRAKEYLFRVLLEKPWRFKAWGSLIHCLLLCQKKH